MTAHEFLESKGFVLDERWENIMEEYVQKEVKDIKGEHIRQLNDAKHKNSQMLDKMKAMVDTNVAQLEAVKMLFDLMKSGFTHRSKMMFCEHSKKVIDIQIAEVKDRKSWLEFDEKIPF
jgi:hypothetical protein